MNSSQKLRTEKLVEDIILVINKRSNVMVNERMLAYQMSTTLDESDIKDISGSGATYSQYFTGKHHEDIGYDLD